ncbi:cell division protein FtsQ/DivIB [Halomonas denitrificans]|nr:cell division protein FtsQ/DivIB [Halomonas denitrificans]
MNRAAWMLMMPAALAVLVAAVWAFGGWQDPERWPIRWLEVEGQLERTTSAQVRAAVAAEARRGFFVVNVERARMAVEALPWVAFAAVSRQWPDALTISVVEHQPVARWNENALVSRRGDAFEVAGTAGMQGLVQLRGPEGRQADVFATWQALAGRLRPNGIEASVVTLDPRGAWTVTLESGWNLLLGREEIEQRLDRFLDVHARLARVQGIRRVDLRYPNGLAIGTGEDTAAGEPATEIAARGDASRSIGPERAPRTYARTDGNHG